MSIKPGNDTINLSQIKGNRKRVESVTLSQDITPRELTVRMIIGLAFCHIRGLLVKMNGLIRKLRFMTEIPSTKKGLSPDFNPKNRLTVKSVSNKTAKPGLDKPGKSIKARLGQVLAPSRFSTV